MTRTGNHALIIALYAVITLVMTWPLAARLDTHVAGSGGDPWQTLWRFEDKWEALRQAQSTFSFAKSEFLGGGDPQLVNLSVWPWMPLHALMGQPLAYNVIWLLSFILSGYAVYLLVDLLMSRATSEYLKFRAGDFEWNASAFIAGLAYSFLPFHVAHSYGHFGAMQLQWIPFIIVLVVSFFRTPNLWKAVGLGVLLLVQAWTEHHYFLWLAILAVIAGIFYRKELWEHMQEIRTKKYDVGKTILISCLLLLISLVFIILSYLPTIRLALQEESPLDLGHQQLIRFSADLFAPVVPPPFQTLWGSFSDKFFFRYFTGNVSESVQYVGIIPLLLIIFFHQKLPGRLVKFWLLVAGIFFFISLGPRLHVFGNVTSIPLPYALIDSWPVISSVRAVARAGSVVGLATIVLFGLVLASQLRRAAIGVVVLLVILLDFLFLPVPTQSAQLHPIYATLTDKPGSRLLEIPAATNYTIASRALYASGIHGKEVIGNIALERAQDREAFEIARSAPALRQLLYLRTNTLQLNRDEFFGQNMGETFPDVMRWLDAATVLIHTDSLSVVQLGAARQFLEEQVQASAQVYDDVLLYDLSAGQLASHDGVFLMRGEGWENVAFDAERGSSFAEVPDTAYGTLVNLNSKVAAVTLTFTVPDESRGQGRVMIAGEPVADIPAGFGNVRVAVELPPGDHTLIFEAVGTEKIIIQNPELEVTSN